MVEARRSRRAERERPTQPTAAEVHGIAWV